MLRARPGRTKYFVIIYKRTLPITENNNTTEITSYLEKYILRTETNAFSLGNIDITIIEETLLQIL